MRLAFMDERCMREMVTKRASVYPVGHSCPTLSVLQPLSGMR